MGTIEEQLTEVYSLIDQLQKVEKELRASIDNALATLHREAPDDPQ
jgi:hypothetical protein